MVKSPKPTTGKVRPPPGVPRNGGLLQQNFEIMREQALAFLKKMNPVPLELRGLQKILEDPATGSATKHRNLIYPRHFIKLFIELLQRMEVAKA